MPSDGHQWRDRLVAFSDRFDRAIAPAVQLVSYLVGIAFGLAAGAVFWVDPTAALVNLTAAVFFVAGGLALRSKFHDGNEAAARRWYAVGGGSIGATMSALSVSWMFDSGISENLTVFVVSLALVVAAAFGWTRNRGDEPVDSLA